MSRARAPRQAAAPRAWQRMLSGRRLDLLDPSPLDVEVEDIAHGLARVARWNGQTRGSHAFSVAQHSLLVESLVALAEPDPDWRLAALIHDGPEYVIGDMISPFKAILGDTYRAVEARLQSAIHLRFGLPAQLPARVRAAIKDADRLSAYHEAVQLAGFSQSEAERFFGRPTAAPDAGALLARPAEEIERAYLDRFVELEAQRQPVRPHDKPRTRPGAS